MRQIVSVFLLIIILINTILMMEMLGEENQQEVYTPGKGRDR